MVPLSVLPATRIQTELHRRAIPVLAASEALVGRVEVNRLNELWPDTGALRHDALHAHQCAQVRRK